eukprot:760325-Hanusia_phi.AAC.1
MKYSPSKLRGKFSEGQSQVFAVFRLNDSWHWSSQILVNVFRQQLSQKPKTSFHVLCVKPGAGPYSGTQDDEDYDDYDDNHDDDNKDHYDEDGEEEDNDEDD